MPDTAAELLDLASRLEATARDHAAYPIVSATVRECTAHIRAVAKIHVYDELVSVATKGQKTGSGRIL
jgi:hypothetical protein